LKILELFNVQARICWGGLITHPITYIMNSNTFNNPNCVNRSAPRHIANRYIWILLERIVEFLVFQARMKATPRPVDGKACPIMKWIIIFAVRPSAHPKERQYALRVIGLLAKIGLFIDWEEAVAGEEKRAFLIEE